MSHSVPSDSSTADTPFLVGADLVQFDHRELPIYLMPDTGWADAGHDAAAYGSPLDRLFGEPGEMFVSGAIGIEEMAAAAAATGSLGNDPLVLLAGLSDGLILPPPELPSQANALNDHVPHMPEIMTVYDFGLSLHDAWTWDVQAPVI